MLSSRPSRRALYLQVRDVLAERITAGEWKSNDPVANENDLARELGVSSGTVRKALQLMETQRLIRRRQGRGTFVNDQTSAEFASRFHSFRRADGKPACSRPVSVEIAERAADGQEQQRLHLAAGDSVYRICRVYLDDDRGFILEHAAVPALLFPLLASRRDIAAHITALCKAYGVLLGKAEERVSLGLPAAAEARALGVAPDAPVMVRDRTVFILDGAPVEWAVAQWRPAGGYYLATLC